MIYTPLQLHRVFRQRLYIDGEPYALDAQASVSRDINDFRATCNVTLIDIPTADIEYKSFVLDMQWSELEWIRVFTGLTLPQTASAPGIQRVVSATDILYYLDTYPATDIEWTNRPYLSAVQDLLTAAGIPTAWVALPATTENLLARATIGQVEPIIVKTTDSIKSTMEALMEFGGYRLYCDASGHVRMIKKTTVPTASAVLKFSTDYPLSDAEYGIFSIKNEIGKDERIISKQIVQGRLEGANEQPSASWSTTAVNGSTASTSSDFCQSAEQCAELAMELGQSACRKELLWNIRMPPDPTLEIGLCIEVKSALVGISTSTPGRIIRQQFDGTDMELTISYNPRAIGGLDDGGGGVGGGDPLPEDGYDDGIASADFLVDAEREGSTYGIHLTDASYSDSGTITGRTWSISGVGTGYPKPALANDVEEQFVVVDTITGVNVTLTITDSNGATATVTKPVVASASEIYTRQLTYVQDGKWYIMMQYPTAFQLDTGGNAPSMVPPYNDTQYIFCACQNGAIYRYNTETSDTNPVLVASLGGEPSCMFQGEIFNSDESGKHLLIGIGNTLYISTNATEEDEADVTFSSYSFGDTVSACSVNPYNPTQLSVTAGTGFFISYDGGSSFVEEHTAASSINDFASFPWAPGTALLTNTNVEPNQTTGTFTSTTMSKITPGLTEEKLIIADASGNFYKSTTTDVTQLHDGTTVTSPSRILRDGMMNDIVWIGDYSTFGVGKMVAESQFLSIIPATTGCTSLGYGRYLAVEDKDIPAPVPPVPPIEPCEHTYSLQSEWVFLQGGDFGSGVYKYAIVWPDEMNPSTTFLQYTSDKKVFYPYGINPDAKIRICKPDGGGTHRISPSGAILANTIYVNCGDYVYVSDITGSSNTIHLHMIFRYLNPANPFGIELTDVCLSGES